jgi:glutamate synthase domain-containing protein 1
MFFLPWEPVPRRRCVKRVEELAALAEADVLGWADVPVDLEALPPGAAARRTAPIVRQALFRRPKGLSEDGWLACRYLLRLALDEVLSDEVGPEFSIPSLSNRTVVYKGLAELSQIARLYPDLRHEDFASRFVLFHSRYSTNTTTAWRRAQPFWALGHNGEISTIKGNVAWMEAIGPDLVQMLVERHPRLKRIGERVRSIICSGGSDTANLDDMVIALLTGGRPDFLNTRVPAGTTDILVSYTYRIAFQDSGQNFGLAAAISTVIFFLVALLSMANLKMLRVNKPEGR